MSSCGELVLEHKDFMRLALAQAKLSPVSVDKYCVGAVLVDGDTSHVLSSGYSCQYGDDLGGHFAECCCFIRFSLERGLFADEVADALPQNTLLYTTMEPGNTRLNGGDGCVSFMLPFAGKLKAVYVGIREPDTFIQGNSGQACLESEGIQVLFPVPAMTDEILSVTLRGH